MLGHDEAGRDPITHRRGRASSALAAAVIVSLATLLLLAGVASASPPEATKTKPPPTKPTSKKKGEEKDWEFSARLSVGRKWERVRGYQFAPTAPPSPPVVEADNQAEDEIAVAVTDQDLAVLVDDESSADESNADESMAQDETDQDDLDQDEDDLAALALGAELPTIEAKTPLVPFDVDRFVTLYRARVQGSVLMNRPSKLRWTSRLGTLMTVVDNQGIQRTVIDARTQLEGRSLPLAWAVPIGYVKRIQGSLAHTQSVYVEPRLTWHAGTDFTLRGSLRLQRETFDILQRRGQNHRIQALSLRPRYQHGAHMVQVRFIVVNSHANDATRNFSSLAIAPRYRVQLGGGWEALANYRLSLRSFNDPQQRRDRTESLGFVIRKRLGPDVKVSTGVSWATNGSTNLLYVFNRTEIVLGVEARFR